MIDKKQELFPYTTYLHGGLTYVPHYKNPEAFVRPGYPTHNQETYTASELLNAGAEPTTTFLWSRPLNPLPRWNEIKKELT